MRVAWGVIEPSRSKGSRWETGAAPPLYVGTVRCEPKATAPEIRVGRPGAPRAHEPEDLTGTWTTSDAFAGEAVEGFHRRDGPGAGGFAGSMRSRLFFPLGITFGGTRPFER